MKYLLSLVLASLLCSSLVFAQGRRHYGHELPIIAGASAQNPIQPSSVKGHDAPQQSGDEDWDVTGNPQCNGTVYAISRINFGLTVIGGEFDSIAGIRGRSLVTSSPDFSDTLLHELGGGTDGVVYAILGISDTDIYVGGNFKHAGSVPANNIAHWNGTTWEALTFGTDSSVLALTIVGDQLFVGGNFRNAGAMPVNHITIWNIKNNTWSPIFSKGVLGVDGGVAALANNADGVVFVGGGFLTAGGDTVNKIVSIENGTWKKLGNGVTGPNSFVAAISADENRNTIVVGGSFTKADTITVSNIASFGGIIDGWFAVGPQVNGPVYAIAANTAIIFGGDFTSLSGEPANHIAATLNIPGFFGSGVNGPVYALEGRILFVSFRLNGGDILVGGDFNTAGNKPFPFFATFRHDFGAVKQTNDKSTIFKIYPNPASSEIAMENSESIADLTIIDALGRSVLSAIPNQTKSPINIANIPDGFYTAMIKSNGKMYSQKLIIEH